MNENDRSDKQHEVLKDAKKRSLWARIKIEVAETQSKAFLESIKRTMGPIETDLLGGSRRDDRP